MNWQFVRREWGAVTFVLTVIIGMVVVPLALYFNNTGPSPISGPTISTASGARASGVHSPSPAVSATPTRSP